MISVKNKIEIFLLIFKERLMPSFFYSFSHRIKNYFILPRIDKDFKKLSLAEHCLWKIFYVYDDVSILPITSPILRPPKPCGRPPAPRRRWPTVVEAAPPPGGRGPADVTKPHGGGQKLTAKLTA